MLMKVSYHRLLTHARQPLHKPPSMSHADLLPMLPAFAPAITEQLALFDDRLKYTAADLLNMRHVPCTCEDLRKRLPLELMQISTQ